MGIAGRVLARLGRSHGDRSLTKGYWEEAAGGSTEAAVHAICDGFTPEQFSRGGGRPL